jgi:glutamate N-acetyltransferase / amino-acid N-acetyltransferase
VSVSQRPGTIPAAVDSDQVAWAALAAAAGALTVERRPRLPLGFAAGAVAAGIKPSGRSDLAVVTVTTPGTASAAATFTRNLVQAAPVRLSRAHLEATGGGSNDRGLPPLAATLPPHGRARAVLVTAGCANAATGPAGDADQAEIATLLAGAVGCRIEETLMASTGLIGTRLPVGRVASGIRALVPAGLGADDAALEAVGTAMMTTDHALKSASVTVGLAAGTARRQARVTGVVKGVGMIHPGMATMIALVLTDARVAPDTLASMLRPAVALGFDQLTVDGDTSTNDTVFALASGASGTDEIEAGTDDARALAAAIAGVCRSLARQQAADGEGATCLITCRVSGAERLADARAISRAVVGSSLLKAAVHGRDPNWGRVAAAAGGAHRADGSAVSLHVPSLRIALCGTPVFDGEPLPFDAAAVRAAMDVPEITIDVDLGLGSAEAEAWGCDLTEAYVRENSEYST